MPEKQPFIPPDSEARGLSESFVRLLLASQDVLYAYLMALTGNPNDAEEALQETNVRLCRQADELPEIQNFRGWACRIAYFEVLSLRKRRARDRHAFDDALLETVACAAETNVEEFDRRRAALDECLSKLPRRHQQMIRRRYSPGGSVRQLAEETRRPASSISQSLYRIRMALMHCIQSTLAMEKQ